MITDWCRALAVALALLVAAPVAWGAASETFSLVYLYRPEDPFYQQHRAYTGLTLRDAHRPLAGAKAAIRESRFKGQVLGLKFELLEQALAEGASAPDALRNTLAQIGARIFIVDLPLTEVIELGKVLAGESLILLNARHSADTLRGANCSPVLYHTLPSQAMQMDALAQFLSSKNWKKILILEGDAPGDQLLADSFQRSMAKFRLQKVDLRSFVLSNDPRLREKNNVTLITSGVKYDVLFLADSVGEFGRYVPYHTQRPLLVVGSEGLQPGAWHWTWERHGAPQLNQRFDRVAKRRMTDVDYAGWAAVKVVVEALVRTESTDVATLRDFLVSGNFSLDTYKGAPGNFRAWNHQLRQPMLLHAHNAVLARAPLPGFLHQKNHLDTLGIDAPETPCVLAR